MAPHRSLLLLCLAGSVSLADPVEGNSSTSPDPVRVGRSEPVRDWVRKEGDQTGPAIVGRGPEVPAERYVRPGPDPDPRKDASSSAHVQDRPGHERTATILLNFDGADVLDNPFRLVPPDPTGDAGPNHYVQVVNLVTMVFDKSGNVLSGPIPNEAIWFGFGGACEEPDGVPMVLYDPMADRWLIMQTDYTVGRICLACSQTADPLGSYFLYEIDAPNLDLPRIGVWNDSYLFTYRDFSQALDVQAGALERDAVLNGVVPGQVRFSLGETLPNIADGLPGDLDGPPLPEGTPGVFVGKDDLGQQLGVWELTVDWQSPENAVLDGPTLLPVDPYLADPVLIPQPGTGNRLRALPFLLQGKLGVRNLGTHLALVTNHTVNLSGRAGIRWYELRTGESGWDLYQQGTFAPDDSEHRWVGTMAMNASGAIALGYAVSSSTLFPSIRFTCRRANDPLGLMTEAEQTVMLGTGSETSINRYGDYAQMIVDPVDDETFWLTHEYIETFGGFSWNTRIASFTCGDGPSDVSNPLPALRPLLEQNSPNPFAASTRVELSLRAAGFVDLGVFDVAGRRVATLYRGTLRDGSHQFSWDGRSTEGAPVPAGVYHYVLDSTEGVVSRQMTLVR